MGNALPSRLDMDQRREMLLERGLQLFGERSYDQVAIGDIARAAGVSNGLLYHYFGGKRDFYVEVVRLAAHRLIEATEPDPALPPPDRVRVGLEAYLDWMVANVQGRATLMGSGLSQSSEIQAILEQIRDAVVDRVMEGLELDPPRPLFRAAARGWVGMVEAVAVDFAEEGDLSKAGTIRLLLGALYGSLLVACAEDPQARVVLDHAAGMAVLGQL